MGMIVDAKVAGDGICDGLFSRAEVFSIFCNEKILSFICVVVEVVDYALGSKIRVGAFALVSPSCRDGLSLGIFKSDHIAQANG